MASSEEAFAKLEMWKKSQTPLKLIMVTKEGMPEILRGHISATDEDSGLVSFFIGGGRWLPRLDLNGASFRLGRRRLEARRGEDSLVFEEE